MEIKQDILKHLRLGQKIFISPKANVCVNKAGMQIVHDDESVSINIKIGNDHIAVLTMSLEAFKALSAEKQEVEITTTREFKKQKDS